MDREVKWEEKKGQNRATKIEQGHQPACGEQEADPETQPLVMKWRVSHSMAIKVMWEGPVHNGEPYSHNNPVQMKALYIVIS